MGYSGPPPEPKRWTFLTNHTCVLTMIARDQNVRLREIAAALGLTQRAVHNIVSDLENGGYITRTRIGRRTRYTIDINQPFLDHARVMPFNTPSTMSRTNGRFRERGRTEPGDRAGS
jgi:DNA-binding transcriptional ArsR family regulator